MTSGAQPNLFLQFSALISASLRLCVEKAFLVTFLAALTGCGYHVSGHGEMLPKTIQTIAIPAFGNRTPRYKLARTLPTDIGHELLSRTKYKIVADPKQADAVLTGTVYNFAAYTTISANGRSTTVEAVVTLNLTFTNRATGEQLYNRAGAEFRERYEISVDPKAYFDESGTAMERLSKSVARGVVSALLEKF
jgi:outer membrane lipopolysaccharide assembly protein LptE/RlpB